MKNSSKKCGVCVVCVCGVCGGGRTNKKRVNLYVNKFLIKPKINQESTKNFVNHFLYFFIFMF